MKSASRFFLCLFVPMIGISFSGFVPPGLHEQMQELINAKKGKIGISVCLIETSENTNINGEQSFPTQSVYKFPLAMAILDAVDKKKLSLDQKIHVTRSDLRANTWSPLRDSVPTGEFDMTLGELLRFSVSKSDNNACDILFRLVGGTGKCNDYIARLGIQNIAIVATETEMAQDWRLQYRNLSTPNAMTLLLKGFFEGEYLSPQSTAFLMKLMTNSENSAKRMRGLLPKDAVVAHKTGTSGTSDEGVRPAMNDVGIITLPNGQHVVVSVFISNSTEEYDITEHTIAEITRLVWDHYNM